jgi:hypothetical protein
VAVLRIKPEKAIAFFLETMRRELLTPMLALRIPQVNFEGARNDTVTLRLGPRLRATARDYEWRTRTAPLVFDDITESEDGIPVKLDTHVVSGTTLTDEHFTLDEIQFARDVLQPQAEAIAARLEAKTVAAWNAVTFADRFGIANGDDPHLIAVEARRRLDARKVAPRAGRFFLIGSDVEASWLATDRLSKYEWTGQAGTPAMRTATVGALLGQPVLTSLSLPPDFAFYGHQTALAVASVAPRVPRGATEGRSGQSTDGWAMRYLFDYDSNFARDRVITSGFYGATPIYDGRVMTGANAGDLLPEAERIALGNVRGVRLDFTGGGVVFTSGGADRDPATAA